MPTRLASPTRRAPLAAATVFIVFAASFTPGCRQAPEAPEVIRPVRAMKIGDASILSGRVFPGRAKATQEVDLSFRVAGPIIERPVDVGSVVEVGDLLARIDPRDFEVSLRNRQAQLQAAEAEDRRLIDLFERVESAHADGAANEIELVRARENAEASTARVAELEATTEAAEDSLGYTRLKAPFRGTVVAIYAEAFQDVREKQVVLRLLDNSRIEMVIEVPEQLISIASLVTDIFCRFEAFPGLDVPATIKEIGTEASETTRTYPITLIMDQPEGIQILPGMTGEARGTPPEQLAPDAGAFEVPPSAIAADRDGQSYVWVIDEAAKTVRRTDVELGSTTPRGIAVMGLDAGVWIATAGTHYLREGQRVRIMDDRLGSEAGTTP